VHTSADLHACIDNGVLFRDYTSTHLHTLADFLRSIFKIVKGHHESQHQEALKLSEAALKKYTSACHRKVAKIAKFHTPSNQLEITNMPSTREGMGDNELNFRDVFQAVVLHTSEQSNYISIIAKEFRGQTYTYTYSCDCGLPQVYGLPCSHNAKHAGHLGLQEHEIADCRVIGSAWLLARQIEFGEVCAMSACTHACAQTYRHVCTKMCMRGSGVLTNMHCVKKLSQKKMKRTHTQIYVPAKAEKPPIYIYNVRTYTRQAD
jgi:hypothetical protein